MPISNFKRSVSTTLFFYCFFAAVLSFAAQVELTPTENFEAYLANLLDESVINDDDLRYLLFQLENHHKVVNPITDEKAMKSSEMCIHHDALGVCLEGADEIEHPELIEWVKSKLSRRVADLQSRQVKQEITSDLVENPKPLVIATGSDHSCAIKSDQTLVCWGSIYRKGYSPIKVRMVAAGGNDEFCAVTLDNQVKCWVNRQSIPVPKNIGAVNEIAVGPAAMCAIKEDESLVCWAKSPKITRVIPKDLGSVKHVTVGSSQIICAITKDDIAQCWNSDPNSKISEPSIPADLGGVKKIAISDGTYCAIKLNNMVKCWGHRPFIIKEPVKQISAHAFSSYICAVLLDDTLKCWGDMGIVGGLFGGHSLQVPVDFGPIKQVSTGIFHMCVVTVEDKVRCWKAPGINEEGQEIVPKNLGRVYSEEAAKNLPKRKTFFEVIRGYYYFLSKSRRDEGQCWVIG